MPSGAKDAIEVVGPQRPVSELPDRPLSSDRRPDGERGLLAHGVGGVGMGAAPGSVAPARLVVGRWSAGRVVLAFGVGGVAVGSVTGSDGGGIRFVAPGSATLTR